MGSSLSNKEIARRRRVNDLANKFAIEHEDFGLALDAFKAGYNQAIKDYDFLRAAGVIGNMKENDNLMKNTGP